MTRANESASPKAKSLSTDLDLLPDPFSNKSAFVYPILLNQMSAVGIRWPVEVLGVANELFGVNPPKLDKLLDLILVDSPVLRFALSIIWSIHMPELL